MGVVSHTKNYKRPSDGTECNLIRGVIPHVTSEPLAEITKPKSAMKLHMTNGHTYGIGHSTFT